LETPSSKVDQRINIEFKTWLFDAGIQYDGVGVPTNAR